MKSTDRRTTEQAAAVGRVAERMAEWMIHDNGDDLFTRFNLSRFAEGKLLREDMIIGYLSIRMRSTPQLEFAACRAGALPVVVSGRNPADRRFEEPESATRLPQRR